jgi:hypothetical protein
MKTRELSSLGHLAGIMQAPPGAIARALAAKGIRPALILNGVAYFDVDQITVKRGRDPKRNARGNRHRVAVSK